MGTPRFWWIDNTEFLSAKNKIYKARSQRLASWSWSRWSESDYDNPDKAFKDLVCKICMPPMLEDGKVICCYGIPKCHANLAKELGEIPDRVLLIIVARPDTRLALYKAGKALGPLSLVEDALKLDTRDAAAAWVSKKASEMGVEANEQACAMLVDFVGKNPSRLVSEISKLKHLSHDGKLHPWVIEEGCYGTGDAGVYELCDFIIKRNFGMAHEYLARLLARGEEPLKICGYLMDWLQKMTMADACAGDYESIKDDVAKLRKYNKPDKKLPERLARLRGKLEVVKDIKNTTKINREIKKIKEKMAEPPSLMFPKPGAVFFSCKNYKEIGFRQYWAYSMLQKLGHLQIQLRSGYNNPGKLMHMFVSEFVQLGEENV